MAKRGIPEIEPIAKGERLPKEHRILMARWLERYRLGSVKALSSAKIGLKLYGGEGWRKQVDWYSANAAIVAQLQSFLLRGMAPRDPSAPVEGADHALPAGSICRARL